MTVSSFLADKQSVFKNWSFVAYSCKYVLRLVVHFPSLIYIDKSECCVEKEWGTTSYDDCSSKKFNHIGQDAILQSANLGKN